MLIVIFLMLVEVLRTPRNMAEPLFRRVEFPVSVNDPMSLFPES